MRYKVVELGTLDAYYGNRDIFVGVEVQPDVCPHTPPIPDNLQNGDTFWTNRSWRYVGEKLWSGYIMGNL